MEDRELTIGQVAARAGINASTVRFYERALAQRKLPKVEALIARAEAMRDWLRKAQHCRCSSLELCALFAGEEAA